jgi:hypothetical protein
MRATSLIPVSGFPGTSSAPPAMPPPSRMCAGYVARRLYCLNGFSDYCR